MAPENLSRPLPIEAAARSAPGAAESWAASGSPGTTGQRVVVVHGGARDNYQLALALEEAGMLEALVTDLFWTADAPWARWLWGRLPAGVRGLLAARTQVGLPSQRIRLCAVSGSIAHVLDRLRFVPFAWRRAMRRYSDARLGRVAGALAAGRRAGLVSYSYYGFHAFEAFGRPAVLFQLHPHPATMRRLLRRELAEHPECAASLEQEWELALPEREYERLVAESHSAAHYMVASSFTKLSLVEQGVPAASIAVIPYGVDLQRFHPLPEGRPRQATLHLLFVGRINQRKGLSYLLEALRRLRGCDLHLTICGRVVDDLEIFREFAREVTIRPSVSPEELVAAYQQADLFVFPSVAEGFGQVLLEALACGLPLLATSHTAAPDLIEEGREGFVVEPRRPDLLAARIRWALEHRDELAEMGRRARTRAESFPWARFRSGCVSAVRRALAPAEI